MKNFIEEDKELYALLGAIGNQIEGYEFTKSCNEHEHGKDAKVLAHRHETLNADIAKLISYVKENYGETKVGCPMTDCQYNVEGICHNPKLEMEKLFVHEEDRLTGSHDYYYSVCNEHYNNA